MNRPTRFRAGVKAAARVVVGAAAVLAVAATAHAQNSALVARAASVAGPVMLTNGNGAPAFAVTAGYAINPGDVVDTRGGGRLVIDLSDGSVVVVHPETVLVLKDYRAAASLRELFQITAGMVRVKINHFGGKPNPYRMNSPTASVAVRGTEFSITVDEQGGTSVEVFEGAVEVSSLTDPDYKVLLEAGRGVLVRPGQEFQLFGARGGRDLAMRPGPAERDRRPVVRMEERTVQTGSQPPGSPQPGPQPDWDGVQGGDRDRRGPMAGTPPFASPTGREMPPPERIEQHPNEPDRYQTDSDQKMRPSPDAASAYERYMASLTDVGHVPFQFRFTAYPENHLDSLENPAYATSFRAAEGRLFVMPSRNGFQSADGGAASGVGATRPSGYSLSPQFSMFTPVGATRFVIGGSVSASRLGSSGVVSTSTSNFGSATAVAAARFGNSSLGFSMESLKGGGGVTTNPDSADAGPFGAFVSNSNISQTRFTAGYSFDLSSRSKVGLYYRYGLIDASEGGPGVADLVRASGHSSEAGFRLRGAITPRLFYGVSASWLGVSLSEASRQGPPAETLQRDRVTRESAGGGIGYLVTRRTLISFDLAGGTSWLNTAANTAFPAPAAQLGSFGNRFVSVHTAIQRDISRRLFATASLLNTWRSQDATSLVLASAPAGRVAGANLVYPFAFSYPWANHYSDFGVGWRFSSGLAAQYVYSTDYGFSPGSHSVVLRYTFRLHPE